MMKIKLQGKTNTVNLKMTGKKTECNDSRPMWQPRADCVHARHLLDDPDS